MKLTSGWESALLMAAKGYIMAQRNPWSTPMNEEKPVKPPDPKPPQPEATDRAVRHQKMPAQSDAAREQTAQQQQ